MKEDKKYVVGFVADELNSPDILTKDAVLENANNDKIEDGTIIYELKPAFTVKSSSASLIPYKK